jgi:hypothetical protein
MATGSGLEICIIGYSLGLDGPGIESRWWARFSAAVQTGPGVHSAFYAGGTGSLPRAKRPGRGFDDPLPSSLVNMYQRFGRTCLFLSCPEYREANGLI